MTRLIRSLIRPYRWTLAIVLLAMWLETAMSLAAPWPLKIILDNVVGRHHLPGWLTHWLANVLGGTSKRHIAAMAALGAVAIAAIGAAASYMTTTIARVSGSGSHTICACERTIICSDFRCSTTTVTRSARF